MSLRALTVTIATGACLLGAAVPASAATGPWKTFHRTAAAGSGATAPSGTAARSDGTVLVGPVAPVPAPAVTVVEPAVAMAARIVTLVDDQRAAAGLPPLKVSTCAQRFGVTWSAHMAATADFSHQSLTPIMTSCSASGAGENIAYGATSADQFMTLWMNSAGHKANILRASFTHIGVGVAQAADGRWYATQDFLTL